MNGSAIHHAYELRFRSLHNPGRGYAFDCDAAGRDYDSIVKSTNVTVFVGEPAEVERIVQLRVRQTGQSEQAIRTRYSGRPEEVAERIREVVALGFNYVIFAVPNAAEGGAIQRVAEEVVPLVA